MLVLIIITVVLLQVSFVALVGLYRRKHQYREIDKQASEPQTLSEPQDPVLSSTDASSTPVASWVGFREFLVQRREIEDGNGSICSFYLVPIDGQPLPSFRPGQFLTFKLQIEDPVTHQPKTVVRCYSLSDQPQPDYYRVSVKRVPAPADQPEAPPGISSNFFHDHIQEGSKLLVRAPSGHFHLMEDKPLPVVLIGGGIGITPMLSMLNTLLENGSTREVWLYYGVRNGAEQIMKEHLQSLDKAHSNFHLHLCYSKPSDNELAGVDYQHKGRVDISLLRTTLKLMRYQFYVCGPKPMMESLVPGLEELGVDTGDIYYESFGPAALVKHEKPKTKPEGASAQTITVTFSKSGTHVPWNPDAGSLLGLVEAQGIEVESGCRAGSCGCCQTALETGEVEYSQQPDADMAPGHCLLCISTPKGDITLAA
ncbi:MAG: 2Fe-2S iron-sulfur cluster-binding protein [Candidatus Thiodiazotropha sp.]